MGTKDASSSRWTYLYNKENGTVLGRDGKAWAQLIGFFTIFYSCLAGWFAIHLLVFQTTLDDVVPKYYGITSILGGNPAMGFRPRPEYDVSEFSFKPTDPSTWQKYTESLTDFMDNYDIDKQQHEDFVTCTDYPPADKVCRFIPDDFIPDECTPERDFGFSEGKPCLAITLNKIYAWIPEIHDNNSFADLDTHEDPDARPPEELKIRFNTYADKYHVVWVTCRGKFDDDIAKLGVVEYYPEYGGYEEHYYPYINHPYYKQPFVMVRFLNVTRGAIVSVECRPWAQNIETDRTDRRGLVAFELEIKDD